MFRLGVLVSGRGTNLQALIDAIEEGRLRAEISVVISDSPEAPALERARRHGLRNVILPPATSSPATSGGGGSRREYSTRLAEVLRDAGCDLVVLAGFMRMVGRPLLDAFPGRVINIHPSLLPSFPGREAQAQAVAHGVRVSGCTVHFVDEGMDSGPIIAQAAAPVHQTDDADALAARILVEEHRLLVDVVRLFAEGRVRLDGNRAIIAGSASAREAGDVDG